MNSKRYIIRAFVAILVGVLYLSSCKGGKDSSPILAQVDNDVLTEEEFRSLFSKAEYEALSSQARKQYIEQWVNLTILAKEANERGWNKDLKIGQRIEYASKKVKANALLAERLAEMQISETELFNYFRVHQAEFLKPVLEYKVQRIFLPERTSYERVKTELASGLAFDNAVRTHSREQLRENGGNMGFVSATSADSIFWQVANKLKRNEIGELRTKDGFFVHRYTEERESNQEADFELY
ncbi:MAG: peptidylprolyl isomerase, partial [Candidatus Cloacimonetes bacterium]|nr:peptidylprolyl isomerase [Candidatus Cloacimonadota bacterium]